MKNNYFLVFLDLFQEVFGQFKEQLLLEFHEMKRVPNVVACPKGFNLLCDRSQMGESLKPTKIIIFKYFQPLDFFFSSFWGA